MNRVIKFRAWCADAKRMTHFDCSGIISNTIMADGERWGMFFPASDAVFIGCYSVMQFTGLHDRNGKEIYEGDMMRLPGCPIDQTVAWNHNDGAWRFRCKKGDMGMAGIAEAIGEVIGNIYENPELLEVRP